MSVHLRRLGAAGAITLTAACISTSYSGPITPPAGGLVPLSAETSVRATVDTEEAFVEVVAGPFRVVPVAPGEHEHDYTNHAQPEEPAMWTPLIPFRWPVDGGLQGFRLAAWDAEGRPLPRHVMHHVIAVNFERRQLVYPIPERPFAFGTETPDFRLPSFVEIPMARGDSLAFYAMWNNETGEVLDGVTVQLRLYYSRNDDAEQILPFYADTHDAVGGRDWFDLPPGNSVHSYEFEIPLAGGLLAAGGHLHDYGTELRLEEVATGRVLVRLESEQDREGRVLGVQQKVFRKFFNLFDARVLLNPGTRYRVVAEFDNPTGRTIPAGGMAHMVGAFAPDDATSWPPLDRTALEYATDMESLPPPLEGATVPEGERSGIRLEN